MRVLKTVSLVHPGPIWNPSRYHYVCLTSIHVLPHLHPCPPHPHPLHAPFHIHPCPKILQFMLQPGHDVGISHPSISCLTSIQVKRIAPQLHPSSTATYPGLKMCVSTQSRPHRTAKTQYLHFISTQDWINAIQITFYLNLYHYNCVSPTSDWSVTSNGSCLTWIQVPRYLCNLHPCSSSLHQGVQICISTQSPSHLQLKSWELHLNSIQITYQLCLAYEKYISPSSRCTLTAIEVHWLASHLHPGNVSLTSWSSLTLILVTIIYTQLHQGPTIPPSRYWGICVSLPSTLLSTPSRPP